MTISILIRQTRVGHLVPNPAYNPEEPEDDTYNPKKVFIDAFPVLEMSDSAGELFLTLLGVNRTVVKEAGRLTELNVLIKKAQSLDHTVLFTQGIHNSEFIAQKFIELATVARDNNKDLIYV